MHKHWRVRIDVVSGGFGRPAFNEVEMAASAGAASQCVGGTATASTERPGGEAADAFDGIPTTQWQAAVGATAPFWIAYEFAAPVSVAELRLTLYTTSYAVSDFAVEHSDDGESWTEAAAFTGVTWTSNGETQAFEVPVEAGPARLPLVQQGGKKRALDVPAFKALLSYTTDAVAEGTTNLYHTPERVDARIAAAKAAVDGVASLVGGKLDASQLPALAITQTFVVNTEAAMLALDCQQGDVAVRPDLQKSFILTAEPASTLSNWQELLSPTAGAVTSFNGRTGAVVPASGDYTAAQVGAATAAQGMLADSAMQPGDNISELTNDAGYAPAPADSGWLTPTLKNGWVSFGFPYNSIRYRKIGSQVYFDGLIKNGVTTDNTVIFTLPTGYYASAYLRLPVVSNVSGSSPARAIIQSDGAVKIFGIGSGGNVSLSGVTYLVD